MSLQGKIKGMYQTFSEPITEEEVFDAERNLSLFMKRLVELDLSQQENENNNL